ncbi:MAG: hypothetical protein ACU0BS_11905 [Hasllibacter sp.]
MAFDVPAPIWAADGIGTERVEATARSPRRRVVHLFEWAPEGSGGADRVPGSVGRVQRLLLERPVRLSFDARLAEAMETFEALCLPAPVLRRHRQVGGRAAIEIGCPLVAGEGDTGAVTLMLLDQSGIVASRLSLTVRGAPFRAEDRAAWPLPPDVARAELDRLWDGFRAP